MIKSHFLAKFEPVGGQKWSIWANSNMIWDDQSSIPVSSSNFDEIVHIRHISIFLEKFLSLFFQIVTFFAWNKAHLRWKSQKISKKIEIEYFAPARLHFPTEMRGAYGHVVGQL